MPKSVALHNIQHGEGARTSKRNADKGCHVGDVGESGSTRKRDGAANHQADGYTAAAADTAEREGWEGKLKPPTALRVHHGGIPPRHA